MKKADILKRKWRKDLNYDPMREMNLDEIRLRNKEKKQ